MDNIIVDSSSNKRFVKFYTSESNQIPIKEVNVPMPWGHVSAQIFGDPTKKNATPILALHGYLDNSNTFKPLAPYLTNEYYIISIDLPGHGFSSKLPDGIPYTPKIFLNSVRRVVKYFELESFVLMAHSYSGHLGFLYDTVFQGELKSLILIDWVFGFSSRKWHSHSYYWKEGIDNYIKNEQHLKENSKEIEEKESQRPPLTMDVAIKILMKANKDIDETTGRILLERGCSVDENGHLKFSRDPNVVISMGNRDHYLDLVTLFPEIKKKLSVAALQIYANPPAFGQQSYEDTVGLVEKINKNSMTEIKTKTFEGTHHFHMIKPKETAAIILEFLDNLKTNPSTKL